MGRSESEVWKHFNVVANPECKYKTGSCKYCGKKNVSNAGRMMKHSAQECQNCVEIKTNFMEMIVPKNKPIVRQSSEQVVALITKNKTTQNKGSIDKFIDTKMSKENHDKLTASFARAVYASACPLSFFDNPYWINQPSTSAACKRNWKDFANIHTKKRNSLLNDRTQKLVSIKHNLPLVEPARSTKSSVGTKSLATNNDKSFEEFVGELSDDDDDDDDEISDWEDEGWDDCSLYDDESEN